MSRRQAKSRYNFHQRDRLIVDDVVFVKPPEEKEEIKRCLDEDVLQPRHLYNIVIDHIVKALDLRTARLGGRNIVRI